MQDTSFIEYFRAATPERELGSLNIGSRPAKRNPKGGIEVKFELYSCQNIRYI